MEPLLRVHLHIGFHSLSRGMVYAAYGCRGRESWDGSGKLCAKSPWALVDLTGDEPCYTPFLDENGAFMNESDAVYAAQVYCPIVDLDHADIAYEWQFQNDWENETSPAGPVGKTTPFQAALLKKLAADYVKYFNSLA